MLIESTNPGYNWLFTQSRNDAAGFSFSFSISILQICFVFASFLNLPSVNTKAFLLQFKQHFVFLNITLTNFIPYFLIHKKNSLRVTLATIYHNP